MVDLTKTGNEVLLGTPPSGTNSPVLTELALWAAEVEAMLYAFEGSIGLITTDGNPGDVLRLNADGDGFDLETVYDISDSLEFSGLRSREAGFYNSLANTSATPEDAQAVGWAVISMPWSEGGNAVQIAGQVGTGLLKARQYTSGVWGGWNDIATRTTAAHAAITATHLSRSSTYTGLRRVFWRDGVLDTTTGPVLAGTWKPVDDFGDDTDTDQVVFVADFVRVA